MRRVQHHTLEVLLQEVGIMQQRLLQCGNYSYGNDPLVFLRLQPTACWVTSADETVVPVTIEQVLSGRGVPALLSARSDNR